jgi:hypothetical protein
MKEERMEAEHIASQRDYCRVLGEIADLLTSACHGSDSERLDALVELAEAWEREQGLVVQS